MQTPDEGPTPSYVSAFGDTAKPPGFKYFCALCQSEAELEVRITFEGRVLWCSDCQKVVGRSFPLRRVP